MYACICYRFQPYHISPTILSVPFYFILFFSEHAFFCISCLHARLVCLYNIVIFMKLAHLFMSALLSPLVVWCVPFLRSPAIVSVSICTVTLSTYRRLTDQPGRQVLWFRSAIRFLAFPLAVTDMPMTCILGSSHLLLLPLFA